MSKITRDSLNVIPTSFATVSVGSTDDPLEDKLKAISSAGFSAVELGFPDLVSFASKSFGKKIKEDDYDQLCVAAAEVQKLCQKHSLGIMMLQPFSNFEGWKQGSDERKDAFDRARGWIKIMQAAGIDMLQVGSSDSEIITGDVDALASDLRELADMLNEQGFRLAYENWCWATHARGWREVWKIVEKVDRPNIGLCLDTFQTAGGEWADPTTASGRIETMDSETLEIQFSNSLAELSQTVPAEKIYLLQISDAYQPPHPLENKPDSDGLRPRGQWSHDFRPCPFNGGYLPVTEVTKAVLKTGFRGWFSMEVFDGGKEGDWKVKQNLQKFAEDAMKSHRELLEDCVESP